MNKGKDVFQRPWPLIGLLLLLILASILFVPVIRGYWLADDFSWVSDLLHYNWREIPRLFLTDWPRIHEYRPLWSVSFITDFLLWGPDPRGLHLTNIFFHVLASLLVWSLVMLTVRDHGLAALLSLAFFVLHPIHPEPVAWISARGHVLVTIFILSSLILLQRFQQFGGIGNYLASLGAAVAAFTTQEAAVALPFLLLARDLVFTSRPDRPWFVRTLKLHLPFWALLGSYLLLRLVLFGRLGRDGMITTIQKLLYDLYRSTRMLWLGPYGIPDIPEVLAARAAHWLLFLLIAVLLVAPFTFLRFHKLENYTRGLIYFAIVWPGVVEFAYFGASAQRHLYLSSIGPCVALGLATAQFLSSKRPFLILGASTMAALLLFAYGWTLVSGVAGFAFNGEKSHQIKDEIAKAIDQASRDSDAIVVIIPEIPANPRVFWQYFYPQALQPPFTSSEPSLPVMPSFASCDCPPEEWMRDHKALLVRLVHGVTGPIYLVEWDPPQAVFVTHVLSQADFEREGYLAVDGSFLRPRHTGDQPIVLP